MGAAVQVGYGAAIASFLGGVHWGAAMLDFRAQVRRHGCSPLPPPCGRPAKPSPAVGAAVCGPAPQPVGAHLHWLTLWSP